jgi:PAS domain S-box-containing protein
MLRLDDRRFVLPAVGTGFAYYVGAQLGTAFTTIAEPVSALWPPNAILLAALLCTRVAAWPIILLAALPAHLAVELSSGMPLPMALSWFVSNGSQALLGAACIRRLIAPPVRFDSFRRVVVFVTFGAVLAPFLSSFVAIAFVQWNAWTFGTSYWDLWRERFFSNALAVLTIVPVIVPWNTGVVDMIRNSSTSRRIEGASLAAALSLLCVLAFNWRPPAAVAAPLLMSIALPLLLWAAVRFGPRSASMCLFAMNVLSIVCVVQERGLFAGGNDRDNVLSVQLFLIGIYIPIMALAAVIRERVRAEHEIRRSEEWLNTVLGAAQMGTWSVDLATQAMRLSERSRELFGFAASASIDGDHRPLPLTPEERAYVSSAATDEVEQSGPYIGEFRVERPDGAMRWIASQGDEVKDCAGRPVRLVGVHADITGRKLAETGLREEIEARIRVESALRASEERCAKAFRASPAAISIERCADGRIIEVNDAWVALLGFPLKEAVGRTRDDLGIGTQEHHSASLDFMLEKQGHVRDFELDVRNTRGNILTVVVACETVDFGGETCLIMMMRDITEHRRAEREVEAQRRQLAHLGRVSLLGELSGAVAHELNQPLAAILAKTRAAQRMLTLDDLDRAELRLILEDVASDVRRAGDVIRRLRRLLLKGDSDPQQVVMNDLVDEVLALAHSEVIQRGATIVTHLSPLLPSIAGDRVQLQQVLLNLLVNAWDAMAENALADRRVVITTDDADAAVRLSISDRGTGITTHPLDTIFDPFVTSKQHGLGLGLSICRSIVNAHGGRLWAENNPERGATFHLLLPRTSSDLHVPPLARLAEQRPVAVGLIG